MRRLGLLAAAMLCATAAPRAAEIASCGNCHGEAGASVDPEVPIIAGLSAAYVTANMTAYRNKERTCHAVAMTAGDRKGATSDMCAVMHDLGAADMKPIGAYFARQTFVPARQAADAALAAAGRQIHQQKCAPCHSAGGSAADDDAGILAGQWTPYLRRQIDEFRAGTRQPPPQMKPAIDALDPGEIDAVLSYYASRERP